MRVVLCCRPAPGTKKAKPVSPRAATLQQQQQPQRSSSPVEHERGPDLKQLIKEQKAAAKQKS